MNIQNDINSPLLTIITVVFNDIENIQETINSVLSQTYPSIEYIIIDGGSYDGTKEIILNNEKILSYWVSEPDEGIYDAINKGIEVANGDIIGLLHSGDIFYDINSLQLIVDEFVNSNKDSIFGDVDIVKSRDINATIRHYSGKHFSKWRLRIGLAPPHPTFYCRRTVYEKVGKYVTTYRVSADYEMMVRVYYKYNISYSYINQTLVKMRQGGESNNGMIGQFQQNMEIIHAAKSNNFYTNVLLVAVKLPFRLIQYFSRK
jgi:glycosyltransferase involved in cell wall biosynthesis